MDPIAQRSIRALQPFNAVDPEHHPLWLVHQLRSTHLHKLSLVTGTIVHSLGAGINELFGFNLYGKAIPPVKPGPITDLAKLAHIEAEAATSQARIHIVWRASFDLAFDVQGPFFGLLGTMARLSR